MPKFLICQPELKNKVYDLATKYFALLGVDWIGLDCRHASSFLTSAKF